MTRRDWLILLAIMLLAAALRFFQLGVTPPGPQFDEAFNAIDAEQIMAGNRPLFLPANGGREVFYSYLQAAIGALLGLNLYTLRLVSAVAGVLTVGALYILVRVLFRRHSQWLATLTALALAISYWHIHFSHYGIRLGLEFYRHPDFFFGHASEVSVFASRVTGDASPWQLLGVNVLRILGMFSFDGDLEWAHGIANRPVFDWFMAIPFYIGVVWWTLRLFGKGTYQPDPDRDSLVLFVLWAAVMMAPSVLSEAAPNYSRTLPAVPTVALAAGLGLTWIVTLPRLQPWWGPAIAGAALAASLVVTVYDYFVRFPSFPEVYYVFDADKVDALQWMHEQVDSGATVYLSPLWSTHATVTVLRDNDIESLDSREAIVLPAPGRSAVYAFPAEQQGDAKRIADLWDAEVEVINDRYGKPLLATVQLTPEQASQWPPAITPDSTMSARFDDAPTLLGVKVGDNRRDLWLYWQEEQPTYRDLTSFVHLLDERNQRVGQSDRAPGDGTYLTPWWSTGERVAQRFTPEITDICAGGEPVRIVTGWYEYAADNARRPRLDALGDIALAGTYTLPFTSVPADLASPPAALSAPISGALALTGYAVNGLPTAVTEGGAPLTLDLYFVGDEASASTDLTVDLVPAAMPAAEGQLLWSGPTGPGLQTGSRAKSSAGASTCASHRQRRSYPVTTCCG
ncbi:MAG: hypothetical protein IPK16_02305 [Anaerolineales bacterium]|nr:hypothetical protein [Anaerolineales bacterium]